MCLGEFVLRGINHAEILPRQDDGRMLPSEGLFINGQCPFKERLGFNVSILHAVQHAQVVERIGQAGIVGTDGLYVFGCGEEQPFGIGHTSIFYGLVSCRLIRLPQRHLCSARHAVEQQKQYDEP